MNTEVLYNNDLDTDINNILQDGIEVVSKDLKIKWYKTFIKNLKNSDTDINYQLTIYLAFIAVMKSLNNNDNIKDAYDIIDVQRHTCIFNNTLLTGWQNYCVSKLVISFHERGLEFAEYRSERIKPKQKQF